MKLMLFMSNGNSFDEKTWKRLAYWWRMQAGPAQAQPDWYR